MKYKNIPSVLHNFGHSFLSDVNIVGDASSAVGEMNGYLKKAASDAMVIDFTNGTITPEMTGYDTGLLDQAIGRYRSSLSEFMEQQGVDASKIHDLKLTYTRGKFTSEGLVQASDDHGKAYEATVQTKRK